MPNNTQKNLSGTAKRIEIENEQRLNAKKSNLKNTIKHWTENAKKEILGTYKRAVMDSYLNVFTENYGDNFDYNSLTRSLTFNIEEKNINGENTITPNFKVNENSIVFNMKNIKDFRNFNENAVPNFTKTNAVIDPDFMNANTFNNSYEYESYIKSKGEYKELSNLEGRFIPTTDAERYNSFTRITKIKGYATRQDSSKAAKNIIQQLWGNIKNKVFSNVSKKFKI